jgi:hypothetical protein
MGSLPYTACAMYVKNNLEFVCWGLVDKISPAFELRNSGVPAVARSFQLSNSTLQRPIKSLRVYIKSAGHCVPRTCLCVAPPGQSPAYTT